MKNLTTESQRIRAIIKQQQPEIVGRFLFSMSRDELLSFVQESNKDGSPKIMDSLLCSRTDLLAYSIMLCFHLGIYVALSTAVAVWSMTSGNYHFICQAMALLAAVASSLGYFSTRKAIFKRMYNAIKQ